MAVELPQYSDPNAPSSGRVLLFANSNGNLALKDSAGNTREYSPTPLESEGMVYGIQWDSVNDIVQPGIVVNGSFVATDYQNFPVQEKMGRGLLTGAGVWTKLHKYNSAKNTDGSGATIDGSSGQVMTYVPRHYQLVTTIGDYKYFLISLDPFSYNGLDAWVPPAFLNNAELFAGAFQGVALTDADDANVGSCVLDTSGYSTNSNPNPFTNRTRAQFRSQCSATGSVFCQWSYGIWEVIYILALVEFKTWDIQSILEGHTERVSFDYADTTQAGATVGLGDFSGSIWDESAGMYIANSYRGIENPFGNVWQWLDGINVDTNDNGNTQQRVYLAFDPSNFAESTDTDHVDSGCAPDFDDSDDFQKDIWGTGKYCSTWPIEVGNGADSASYITDYFWSSSLNSGWKDVQVGGKLDYGRQAGFRALATYGGYMACYTYIGVRLGAYI